MCDVCVCVWYVWACCAACVCSSGCVCVSVVWVWVQCSSVCVSVYVRVCGAYMENTVPTVKHPRRTVELESFQGCRNEPQVRSWLNVEALQIRLEKSLLPKQTVQVGVGERNTDRRVQSGRADISCGSLTLPCSLHKFHSELLSVKLMKSQTVQQRNYRSVVFHWVSETSPYHRCA